MPIELRLIRVLPLVMLLGIIGCGDGKREAVKDLVGFAQQAPFKLGPAPDKYSGRSILVLDEALPDYNKVFSHFGPDDSVRAEVYQNLPATILWQLPISTVQKTRYHKGRGDTLIATVVFTRPDASMYDAKFTALVYPPDGDDLTDTQERDFRDAIVRVRNELQQTDTAYIYLVEGPRIVMFRTGTWIRDSIRNDSIRVVAMKHLERLVGSASITVAEVSDYSILGNSGGGSVKGFVDPGSVGWYRGEGYASVSVECEGSREGVSTKTRAAVITSRLGRLDRDDYLCAWFGEEASEWSRVKPRGFRVRLVAAFGLDSLHGPWEVSR